MNPAPILYPEKDEFKDYSNYFNKIKNEIDQKGMVLIKPPMVNILNNILN